MRLLVSLWKMFCYTAGTAVIGLAVYEFWFFSQILYWVDHNPATTRVIDARLETSRPDKPKALEQKWMDYERISIHLKRAIIIAVDAAGLEPEQAARLAAMLPRPRYYDRNRSSPYLASYSESILAQMSAAQVP